MCLEHTVVSYCGDVWWDNIWYSSWHGYFFLCLRITYIGAMPCGLVASSIACPMIWNVFDERCRE